MLKKVVDLLNSLSSWSVQGDWAGKKIMYDQGINSVKVRRCITNMIDRQSYATERLGVLIQVVSIPTILACQCNKKDEESFE